MIKTYTRNRNYTRRSRTRRHHRGGDLLRFRYTTDPKRVAWIEALYPYSSQIASIPGLIPWNKYSYDGKTTLNLKKTKLDIQIKATADEIPYVIGGGAACELYNAKFKKLGGPNLHETVDPTADVDIFLQEPVFSIEQFSNNYMYSTITGVHTDRTLSPLYDHYTRWVFEHLVNILGTFAPQMPSPRFLVPTEESISKLVNSKVDLQTRVGNILILRQVPEPDSDHLIKIQCITTVQTKEGLQVTDHFCEFLLDGHGIEITPYINEIQAHSLKDIPGISVPSLFVERPTMLIDTQQYSFDERKDLKDKTKAKNHYGRIIFLYKLGLFLQANKYNTGTLNEGGYYSEKGFVDLKKRLGNFADI